ncbi:MAG: twin-arginine translocation signal domain-containing protein [Candidatus Thorarchaeota archaeon]
MNRRSFLKRIGCGVAAGPLLLLTKLSAKEDKPLPLPDTDSHKLDLYRLIGEVVFENDEEQLGRLIADRLLDDHIRWMEKSIWETEKLDFINSSVFWF